MSGFPAFNQITLDAERSSIAARIVRACHAPIGFNADSARMSGKRTLRGKRTHFVTARRKLLEHFFARVLLQLQAVA